MAEIAVLINPAAGNGNFRRQENRLHQLFKENGLQPEIIVSKSGEDFLNIASAAARTFKILAIAGGDSSLSLALNAIKTNFPVFAFIPLGSCNDIGLHFQNNSLQTAILKIQRKNICPVPIGKIVYNNGEKLFLGQCSCGAATLLNQEIVRRRTVSPCLRKLPRFISGLISFKAVQPLLKKTYQLNLDGESFEEELGLAVFSLISFFSCGLRLFNADNSSKLQFFGLKTANLRDFAKLYFHFKKKPVYNSNLIIRKNYLNKIIISSDQPFRMQYDGEIISSEESFSYAIELFQEKLPFIV